MHRLFWGGVQKNLLMFCSLFVQCLFTVAVKDADIDSFCGVIDRFTYEIAPVFVLMEQLTLKKMREMIGWPDGEGDGLFSPGSKYFCAA